MRTRLDIAHELSRELTALTDDELTKLVVRSPVVGLGIGGTTRIATVNGRRVFIKQLPVTAREADAPTATRSVVDLPFAAHYGIGSPSFGVGRELAAHEITSEWVRAGLTNIFPLLLDWRVVNRPCDADLSEFDDDVQRRWGSHWPHVLEAVDAMKTARSSAVIILEHVADTFDSWMRDGIERGEAGARFTDAVSQIVEATAWMEDQRFFHFDMHPGNMLVSEGRLLFTDFGLALHPGFDLSAEERNSLELHCGFDRDSALMSVFHWVLVELGYVARGERTDLLRSAVLGMPRTVADRIRDSLGSSVELFMEHAPTVLMMTEMFDDLITDVDAKSYRSVAGQSS